MTTIAIDFGTSRTKLAYRNARGEARLLRFERDEFAPSVFYLPRGSDAILWGDEAAARVDEDPGGVVEVLKRKLRDPRIRANGRSEPPSRLLTHMLADLRARTAEIAASSGTAATAVTLTLPAMYGPFEDKLLREAAAAAGFTQVDVVQEPVAAARAWLAETGERADEVVVFDAGGGTLDWAFLRRDDDDFRVVPDCPPGGDARVGGYDVDQELLEIVRERLAAAGGPVEALDERPAYWRGELRRIKERLGRGGGAPTLRIDGRTVSLSEADVRQAIEQRFIEQACVGLGAYLEQVREHTRGQVPPVLLVGGSARTAGLREALEHRLKCRTHRWDQSDYATVLGGLIKAGATIPDPRPRPVPQPQRRAPWHFYSSDAYSASAALKSLTKVRTRFGTGLGPPPLDATRLLETGVAEFKCIPYAGFFGAEIDEAAWLASGNELSVIRDSEYIAGLGISTDTPTSRFTATDLLARFEQQFYRDAVLEAVLLKVLGGDDGAARRHLQESTKSEIESVKQSLSSRGMIASVMAAPHAIKYLTRAAACWSTVFDDQKAAHDCLRAVPDSGFDHRKIASTYLALWDDRQSALICVADAEKRAKGRAGSYHGWLSLAECYLLLFGNNGAARDCVMKAEQSRKRDWLYYSWICGMWILLNEMERCRLLLVSAEFPPDDWGQSLKACAGIWKMLGDTGALRRLLKVFECQVQEDSSMFPDLADAWLTWVDDLETGQYWLQRAESSELRFDGAVECARLWHEHFGDRERAERLLGQAETLAKYSHDFSTCALVWRRLGNAAEAKRCQAKARDLRR